MTYTNSSLVDVRIMSPNYQERTIAKWGNIFGVIDTITIHHMACNGSIEALGYQFAQSSRWASSTYGIGSDGRIGQYVDEKFCPWTSSNLYNDSRAITIEVANDQGAPTWHVSDKALASLIKLCTDICKRNNIKKLNYTGDTSGNLTMHCWFAATACPGPYLKSKFAYIADEVNKNLADKPIPTPTPSTDFKVNDVVKLTPDAVVYGTNRRFADFAYKTNLYITNIPKSGSRYVVSTKKNGPATGAVDKKYLKKVSESKPTPTPKPTLPGYTGVITYSAFANNNWWSDIKSTNVNSGGTNAYAGVMGIPINAIRAKAQYGKLWMSVHTVGGDWSNKVDLSTGAYAGSNTARIDGVKIWSETGHVDFRVHTKGGQWWSWIDSRNCNRIDYNSYAGVLGTQIDAIQMQ